LLWAVERACSPPIIEVVQFAPSVEGGGINAEEPPLATQVDGEYKSERAQIEDEAGV
jgi:hypothetical protein